jgi:urease accessory protein
LLLINSIKGNIYQDSKLAKEFENSTDPNYKQLILHRHELEKTRFRKTTTDGTDVGISIDNGKGLHHGDILELDQIKILIRQEPEKLIRIKINDSKSGNHTLVMIGHIIGNRHRPIQIDVNGDILFPIQRENELELFQSLFHDISDKIQLNIENKIFEPNKSMDVHEHG